MTDERMALIDQLEDFPARLAALVAPLNPTQLTTPFLEGEWTIAQNIHHLADSHMNSYIRCKLIATEEHPPLKPYDQDQWAALPDASAANVALSLQLLSALHSRWATFWRHLPAEAWQRTGYHPERGSVTLAEQLDLYVAHGEGHIEQITRTAAAAGLQLDMR